MPAATVMDPAITARGLSVAYGTGSSPVLRDLDLAVESGSFCTLLGPSGCGKSTLLHALGGMLEPTTGSVEIGGRSADDVVRDKRIGFVPQRAALLPWKTALANAAMLHQMANGDTAAAKAAARDALELVGLGHAAGKLPHELSGGMAQRVSIARALAMDPLILLMDEPFGALDAITRDQMNVRLSRIWAETRKTLVFVTHSIPEAVFLSDEVQVMATGPGRIVERVVIDLPRPRSVEVFDSPDFAALAARLRELLEVQS